MGWDKARGPRIAFLGTGAQGASIGADFVLAGLDVTFIEQWPDHVMAIREHGITVNLPSRTINAKVPALHLCQVADGDVVPVWHARHVLRDWIVETEFAFLGEQHDHRGRHRLSIGGDPEVGVGAGWACSA